MNDPTGQGVKGYARALYEIAQVEGDVARVSDELFRVARAVESHTELRRTLTDIGVPFAGKEQLLQDLLGKQASPHTLNALRFVISQGKARELVEIADELSRITAEESNKELAEVRSAVPLDSEQRAALARALKEATGRNVEVKTIVDPSVIGGVLAKVGDIVIDGTVRGKLAQLKQHLGVD
ncbi:MAG TPA: ATP synthase F1 subunit delta [Actinomycetota bacterium]|nr:ATP synthase F1 subunit delta [Actinomycetota bacterium]